MQRIELLRATIPARTLSPRDLQGFGRARKGFLTRLFGDAIILLAETPSNRAPVAQGIEQRTSNPWVAGSIPARRAISNSHIAGIMIDAAGVDSQPRLHLCAECVRDEGWFGGFKPGRTRNTGATVTPYTGQQRLA